MANGIKGITIESGGNITGPNKAAKSVNSFITKTQSALNEAKRLLKLDPSNTVPVAQKGIILAQALSRQETLNMAAQAFGTMAEDRNLKFMISLTSGGETYDRVVGASQNLFSQIQSPMQEMEANTRRCSRR